MRHFGKKAFRSRLFLKLEKEHDFTNLFERVYFNDFIKTGITNNIKERVIFNGLSGSSYLMNQDGVS